MITFFHGKNQYEIEKETKRLVSDFESKKFDIENIDGEELYNAGQVTNSIQSQGLFSSKKLIVVKNLQIKNKDSEVKAEIAENVVKLPEGVEVLFIEEGDVDRRGKLYKTLHKIAKVNNFPELNSAQIEGFITSEVENKKFSISNTAVRDLSMAIGSNLYLLENEIEKLILYAKSQKANRIEENHVKEIIESIADPQIFPFIEAVASKNVGRSMVELQKFAGSNENEHYLLSMIIYQFRTLLIIKDLSDKGKRASEITKIAKLHPFVVQKSIQIVNKYSKIDLIRKYFLLHSTDVQLKTGDLDPKIAIDLLVAKIAS